MVVFEVLGDSNISRSWKAVAADYDKLKGSILRSVTTLPLLKDSLRTVAQSTSALSNPVSRLVPDGTDANLRIELNGLFDEILDCLIQTVNCNPNLQVRVSYFLTCDVCSLWIFKKKVRPILLAFSFIAHLEVFNDLGIIISLKWQFRFYSTHL